MPAQDSPLSPPYQQSFNAPVNHRQQLNESPSVPDEDSCLQVFREMSQWEPSANTTTQSRLRSGARNREVVEYQGVANSVTILGEVLAPRRPRRLVRIQLRNSHGGNNQQEPVDGLDGPDREFLRAKGALSLPDKAVW